MPLIIPGTNDAYTMGTLTEAFSRVPYVPGQLTGLLPIHSAGLPTNTALIEHRNETFDLIDERAYNSAPSQVELGKAGTDAMESLYIPHYPHAFTVRATEVRARRRFSTENEFEMPEDVQTRKFQTWQRSINFTWEYTGIGGFLFGVIPNRFGAVQYDLRKKFKRQPIRLKFNFGSGDNLFKFLNGAKWLAQQALGSYPITGWTLLGDKPMNDKVIYDPSVQKTYYGYEQTAWLRDDHTKKPFTICDDIKVVAYRNALIPRTDKLAFPTKALVLIPEMQDQFQRRFAPAMTLSDINEVGAPVYLSPFTDPHNEFVEIKGQTNTICWNQRYESMVIIEHGETTDLEALGYYGQDTDSVYDSVEDLTAEQLGLTEQDVGNPRGLEEALAEPDLV